jgi:hypothetical protein
MVRRRGTDRFSTDGLIIAVCKSVSADALTAQLRLMIGYELRRPGSGLGCFVFQHLNFGLRLPLQGRASVFCVL